MELLGVIDHSVHAQMEEDKFEPSTQDISTFSFSPLICVVGTVLPEFIKRGQRHDGYTEKKNAASAVHGRHRNS